MRSYNKDCEYDKEELARLNPEPWQVELLSMNPSYTCWGPHEDYMWKDGSGWDSRQIRPTWGDFASWGLDDLNECVNFYFSVERESEECPKCGGDGYHPDGHHVGNGFYSHMNEKGESWCDKITQDEVAALMEAGRLWDYTRGKPEGYVPTAEEVNAGNRRGGIGGTHDAINRSILTRTRLARLGLPETCDKCDGHGHVFTSPAAHVTLTLWMLHPRKGCSRGVEVTVIQRDELPAVFAYLREAAQRNANRFSMVP